ncbi:hypothetical protein [Roseibium denhamense]|uniref:Uncharacterized protein n=1 Tax=Roseibium denhamense TaxID=76305 RepID=A0ABY1NRN2_9HYPH|nr:hypothetical protein [Roseibium denhamense]SMP15274.1 hypothetical protein SAMN06265374_1560 [Roseibium denhamense]
MQRNTRAGTIALGLIIALAGSATAAPLPQETITIPDDRLAVTVASASLDQVDPLESEFTIWVGEIELEGRKTVWVELIDSYGEVIYDSEVNRNETHLLPDGRAVVVRAMAPETAVAGKDESRLVLDGALTVTRRVVNDAAGATTVELIETGTEAPAKRGTMLQVADFGQMVWERVVAFFDAAGTRVKVAWNWIVDTLQA